MHPVKGTGNPAVDPGGMRDKSGKPPKLFSKTEILTFWNSGVGKISLEKKITSQNICHENVFKRKNINFFFLVKNVYI